VSRLSDVRTKKTLPACPLLPVVAFLAVPYYRTTLKNTKIEGYLKDKKEAQKAAVKQQ
jgi:hypothetical protein